MHSFFYQEMAPKCYFDMFDSLSVPLFITSYTDPGAWGSGLGMQVHMGPGRLGARQAEGELLIEREWI